MGRGTWDVKNGVICSDLVWYYKDGAKIKSKPGDSPECIAHVVDADGKMWRRGNDDADWSSVTTVKNDTSASKGFKFKSKLNRTSKKFGL